MPIRINCLLALCTGDTLLRNEFNSIVLVSISNVPMQCLDENRWPSMKRSHFLFLIEKPHFYESGQGQLPQGGTRMPVGIYPIVAIGETHGRSLNPGKTRTMMQWRGRAYARLGGQVLYHHTIVVFHIKTKLVASMS